MRHKRWSLLTTCRSYGRTQTITKGIIIIISKQEINDCKNTNDNQGHYWYYFQARNQWLLLRICWTCVWLTFNCISNLSIMLPGSATVTKQSVRSCKGTNLNHGNKKPLHFGLLVVVVYEKTSHSDYHHWLLYCIYPCHKNNVNPVPAAELPCCHQREQGLWSSCSPSFVICISHLYCFRQKPQCDQSVSDWLSYTSLVLLSSLLSIVSCCR